MAVRFEDVSILQATPMAADASVTLSVLLDRRNHFQVCSLTGPSTGLAGVLNT